MQLIGMLDSPYVRRVAIVLIMAKTPFIHRPISLFRHIDQFSKFNPLLKAPTLLTDDGVTLMDSSVILDFLAGVDPRIAAQAPSTAPGPQRLAALRATALALTSWRRRCSATMRARCAQRKSRTGHGSIGSWAN
jgi:glutathione S-transferase